jgi:hypothetical protein
MTTQNRRNTAYLSTLIQKLTQKTCYQATSGLSNHSLCFFSSRIISL